MFVDLINYTPNPCKTMSLAARTCYSDSLHPQLDRQWLELQDEKDHWNWLCEACLNKGHFSPLEYSQFVIIACNIPMTTIVQLRTHRGLSMQVQSMRYTGKRIQDEKVGNESLFYSRTQTSPDRQGLKQVIDSDILTSVFNTARETYSQLIETGVPPEVARDILPSCYTQNFIMSCNMRELFHLWGMRSPKDSQLEIRQLVEKMRDTVYATVPEPIEWYMSKHWAKYKGCF